MDQKDFFPSLSTIAYLRNTKRKRVSSYDRTGGNQDYIIIAPGETRVIADLSGSGSIKHIWSTMSNKGFVEEENYLRKIVIQMYWDNEQYPSVEVPIGDFFGMGHSLCRNYVSAPLQMSPQDGKSFNCWFPMPFSEKAVIKIVNECDEELIFYFYIDYEEFEHHQEKELLRFHASWNREYPTQGIEQGAMTNDEWQMEGENITGDNNYIILEAEGRGHYVGCNVNIHNLRETKEWNWPGEGDDMIFIDGEEWPPIIHGTGTEDYFNTAWCPTQEYNAPYHGIILPGGENWSGKISYYRYHILDPITFKSSIKVSIEHGHNNHRSDDWSSTAYWYQQEPHKKRKPFPVEERIPLKD
jgi:D-arabinan exo alpha-(1,3)/(1,5)-arabinofuranosidase (non-reducing end)